MSLNNDLKLLYEQVMSSLPADIKDRFILENKRLLSLFLEDKALKSGEKAPDILFRDKDLKPIYLSDVLKDYHVVLSFFRGSWCPYCNLELRALAAINPQIEEKGARLITMSPELFQYAEESLKRNKIQVPVYTDLGNRAADQFGLVFELPPKYRAIYQELSLHLDVLNGEDSWTLPMPATFIISKEGVITSVYVNADYTQRMEPEDILAQLDLLS